VWPLRAFFDTSIAISGILNVSIAISGILNVSGKVFRRGID